MKPQSVPKRNRGQILVVAALSAVVLIGFAALAIDSGISYAVKAKLNAAVDAAAIAAARATVTGATDSARTSAAIAAGQKFFDLNFPPGGYLGAKVTSTGVTITPVHQTDGKWSVTAFADAQRDTYLMGVLGLTSMTVHAQAGSVRRDVDMILVLDTSGSLGSAFAQVKASAISFLGNFASSPGGDRVGLVLFSSGAVLSVPIDKDNVRGFDINAMTTAINAIPQASGSTASSEGLRLAHDEIDRIDPGIRSSLRVIVFFSDGAPNDVTATFSVQNNGGHVTGTVTGDLYSDTTGGDASLATAMYSNAVRDQSVGTYNTGNNNLVPTLPANGLTTTAWGQAGIPIALTSYDSARSFINWPAASHCNVNMAARNMAENVAYTIRGEGIYVYTLGLGAALTQLEPQFTPNDCGYKSGNGQTEIGQRILQRMANAPDPNDFIKQDPKFQPVGMYVYAADANALDSAFHAIASEILRLSQ
jgi:Flp pilus assembly protein TadG